MLPLAPTWRQGSRRPDGRRRPTPGKPGGGHWTWEWGSKPLGKLLTHLWDRASRGVRALAVAASGVDDAWSRDGVSVPLPCTACTQKQAHSTTYVPDSVARGTVTTIVRTCARAHVRYTFAPLHLCAAPAASNQSVSAASSARIAAIFASVSCLSARTFSSVTSSCSCQAALTLPGGLSK